MKPQATDELSADQARKIVIQSQGIHQRSSLHGERRLLAAIEQLGYVQIDTISVVERAHHHTLWNRVSGYRPQHLNNLLQKRKFLNTGNTLQPTCQCRTFASVSRENKR